MLPLIGLHILLLLTVGVSDLLWRTVPRLWSAAALATGLVTALLAPFPGAHLGLGCLSFGYGYHFWVRGQRGGGGFGGGDVWMLTYLGLTFGSDAALVILLGFAVAWIAVALRRVRRDDVPQAACWAAAGLLALLVPGVSLAGLGAALLRLLTAPSSPGLAGVPVL